MVGLVAHNIRAALAAVEARDLAGARQAVAAARRALGQWGGPPLTAMDQVSVSLATGTRRETIAINLANAANALRGDTWPEDLPYHVQGYIADCGPDDEPDGDVAGWLRQHSRIAVELARISLRSALHDMPANA